MNKSVLFVDDEAHILQGLRRLLRPLRQDWHMDFVGSGREALERLAHAPCDVLVSDMRMPGMDGVGLLEDVREHHPQVIRIVLSGQADRESTLSAVGPAHQYLSKPCDPVTLRDTIERALTLRAGIANEAIAQVVSKVQNLPTVPAVYLELKTELASPDGSAGKVAEIIAGDPAMTAKILQVVNSAFFGVRREVVNPLDAVRYLGFDLVQALALSAGVFGQATEGPSAGFAADLWRHSFTTAGQAKVISRLEAKDGTTVETAMTAGLLHDVGKLVLLAGFGQTYVDLLENPDDPAPPLWQREQEAFGTSHAEVGGYLLSLWGLPDRIAEIVAFHHRPHELPDRSFTPLTAVHVANSLAHPAADSADVNVEYLEQCDLYDRVAEWQRACQAVTEGEEK